MADWNYGEAYKRFPVAPEEEVRLSDGSILMAHDIFDGLPPFMKDATILFTDSPWSLGNMRAFYTKAGKEGRTDDFMEFADVLFRRIEEIRPRLCFLEIGKEFLAEYVMRLRHLYPRVTFYNSTYYHRKGNLCYVVQGSGKRLNLHLDGVDEEDIIKRVAALDVEGSIGDLCMGRGLVAMAALAAGRRFVGTELNPKRLAVAMERLAKFGCVKV